MGGLGGLIGGQFGMNADLDKLEILVKNRDVVESVIRKHDLMPRLYPKLWDPVGKKWKGKPEKAPQMRKAIESVRNSHLEVLVNPKKQVVTVKVFAPDSVLARDLVGYLLEGLNAKLRTDAMEDAEANRRFLEEQMVAAADPLIREKIQQLIAAEIEKSMLVGTRAFEILERPVVPMERLKPQRKKLVIMSLLLGLLLSSLCAIGWEGYFGGRPH
jgi:uncharacterized protein involved in exopolysaccharide biosynthesis